MNKLFFLSALSLIICISMASADISSSDPALNSYWGFNVGGSSAVAPNENNAYITLNATLFSNTLWSSIRKLGNYSSSYGASGQYTSVGGVVLPNTNWTVNVWVNRTVSNSNDKFIFSQGTQSNSQAVFGGVLGSTENLSLAIFGVNILGKSVTSDINNWHMYTFMWNSANNTAIIYRDGVFSSSYGTSAIDIATPNSFHIGAREDVGGTGPWQGYIDEMLTMNRTLTEGEILELYNNGTGLAYPFYYVNITNVNLSPSNNTYIYSLNSSNTQIPLTINLNINVTGGKCYYNTSFSSTLTEVTCGAQNVISTVNIFGKQTIFAFGRDILGNEVMNSTIIWMNRYLFNNQSLETKSSTFSLEVWNQTQTPTGILNYNGTNYTATVNSMGNGKYGLNATIDIPIISGIKNFFYYWVNGQFRTSDTRNQTINQIDFGICNATLTTKYLNISFRNETVAQERVNAALSTSSVDYWLGSGTQSKTYTLTNAAEVSNYTFCFSPAYESITAYESINYYNSISPQRSFMGTLSLSNVTTNQQLFLLPTTVGIYVSFQVINPALQPIEGVAISISSSVFGAIETKNTDAAGSATFFLNPLISYSVVATKAGLPTYSTTITPTQTEYTITMGASGTNTSIQDYSRGITYSFGPAETYLTNNTSYDFNFTINSQFWNLEEYGIRLTNASGSSFGTDSDTTATGGTVQISRNTGSNQTLILNAYYVIQGNYTNVSKIYVIFDSDRSDTSLANLRDRIRLYINNGGFFGMTPFGLNLIVFLIIFVTTGIASWKFGFVSPFAIFAFMLAITMIFDYMNLITYAESLPEDSASLILAILVAAFGIREAYT